MCMRGLGLELKVISTLLFPEVGLGILELLSDCEHVDCCLICWNYKARWE
jgi:hypothetical protein